MVDVTQNDRTAFAVPVTKQEDGAGLRCGKLAEVFILTPVCPAGGDLFRQRIAQFQAEAAYWEDRVGTVHEFRMILLDNDTKLLLAIIYDGSFTAYIADIVREAAPWFDELFPNVWEGYVAASDEGTLELVKKQSLTADFLYVSNADMSVRDITKSKKISQAFSDLLDAAG